MADSLTLYREVGRGSEQCDHGFQHEVVYFARKIVRDTGKTWLCNNGYEKQDRPIYVDGHGNWYRKYVSIDYSNNVWYLDDDNKHWYYRVRLRSDQLGRIVGTNEEVGI